MAIEVKKKEGESAASLIFRFTKKIKQSGVLLESKKRRFSSRVQNDTASKKSALYRLKKKTEIDKARKEGLL
jgi:ribosomal protein S21